ncbi:MAG: tryptophan 7-halogenase [Sphingomonadales bacterium]|jgi:tryptophan halogenase|nr:tryptophan 7-halogenase [Sphingomonadales bacterium]
MTAPSLRVVMVGRDAALWLTASALQRALGAAAASIVAVELPTALGASSVYASLPPLEALHNKLGLDESALLHATRGSFSLGCNIVDKSGALPPFFLAYGAYGAPIDGGSFFHYWNKARHFGLNVPFEDFCLTAMAARQGRMLLPDEATLAFGRTDYGYHLPAIAYAAALKAHAAACGVAVHHVREILVERSPDTGEIAAVRLDGGLRIEGDLFIDATGGDALLIGAAAGAAGGGAASDPVVDRRLTARARPFAPIPAYAETRLGEAGWATLYASQAAIHVVHAFASAGQSDEEALAAASDLAGLPLVEPVMEPIAHGCRDSAWEGNCVAIGAGACAPGALFDLELHAIQLGIVHLLALFPAGASFAAERAEYNRITRSAFERLLDLPSAFQALNRFGRQGMWGRARAADVPAAVAHKIATFRARGEIPPMEDETFAPDFWQALFVGLGEMPDSWPPAIDRTPPERMKAEFRRILGFVKEKVLEQPTHDSCLKRLSRSEAA